jgi:GMP synthase (glutamine-hydrolysing)
MSVEIFLASRWIYFYKAYTFYLIARRNKTLCSFLKDLWMLIFCIMKNKSDLKILLLQIREDPIVRKEELSSFAIFSSINESQITIHNVFDKPVFEPTIIEGFDALFIGGASEASVLEKEKYHFLISGYRLIHYVVEKSIPTFASCFGFQMAVMAFGGSIIRDTTDFEMGTCPINIKESAKDDPIFYQVKTQFLAVSVHQEKAMELPDNCELLADNENCCQVFRVKQKPFWAFQFHPELDRETLTQRLNIFKEKYTDNIDHFNSVIQSLKDTPDSNSLLNNFIKHIIQ